MIKKPKGNPIKGKLMANVTMVAQMLEKPVIVIQIPQKEYDLIEEALKSKRLAKVWSGSSWNPTFSAQDSKGSYSLVFKNGEDPSCTVEDTSKDGEEEYVVSSLSQEFEFIRHIVKFSRYVKPSFSNVKPTVG